MKLLFVRHGETDPNKNKTVMGSEVDASLNEHGVAEVRGILATLPNDFEIIFSSPLVRAYKTAEIIAEHFKKEIETHVELKEKSFGSLAGKTWPEIEMIVGSDAKTIDRQLQYDYRVYGGESVEEVMIRVNAFVNKVRQGLQKKTLVVSHGGVIRVMYELYRDEIFGERIENASLHEFEV